MSRRWGTALGCASLLACSENVAQDARDTTLVVNEQASLPLEMTQGIGHVSMTGCVGFDFLAPFNVGGQVFHLLVDSGSTTLAVAGAQCATCSVKNGYRLSTTSSSTPFTASSRYLDGSEWFGSVVADAAAAASGNVLVTPVGHVQFARIDKDKGFFQRVSCTKRGDTDFDGIIGLGPDAQLEGNTTSFLSVIAATGKLARDAFALQTCDVGGELWFGGLDPTRIAAEPNFAPLIPVNTTANRNNAYAIDVVQMSLAGTDFGLSVNSLGPMIVDNGTSSLVLSKSAFAAFAQIMEADPVYVANFGAGFIMGARAQCMPSAKGLSRDQLDAQMPKLSFVFPSTDGGSFVIELTATQSYLVAGIDDGDASKTVRYCPAVVAGETLAIFGNVAMRSHVMIFDRAGQRVGFAPQQGCQPTPLLLPGGT